MSRECIRPSWKHSNECSQLCRVLIALKKQHPELCNLPATLARQIPSWLCPPLKVLLVHSDHGLYLVDEVSGAELHCLFKGIYDSDGVTASSPGTDQVAAFVDDDCVHLLDLYADASHAPPGISIADHLVSNFCSRISGCRQDRQWNDTPQKRKIALSGTGSYLAVGLGDTLLILGVKSRRVERKLRFTAGISSSACSSVGDSLAIGLKGGHVVLIDLEADTAVQDELSLGHRRSKSWHSSEISSLSFSPSGRRLAATFREMDADLYSYMYDLLHMVDVASGTVLWSVDFSCGSECTWYLEYSPDGSVVAVSDEDGGIFLLDAETADDMVGDDDHDYFDLGVHPVRSLAFSTSGSHLAVGKDDGMLYLLNMMGVKSNACKDLLVRKQLMPEGDLAADIGISDPGCDHAVDSLSFSASGMRLAAGTGTVIHIVDTKTGAELQALRLSGESRILGIDYKFCLPETQANSLRESMCDDLNEESGEDACIIQAVDHDDFAAEICPCEATQIQDELWASAVERRMAAVASPTTLLLLTFARQTQRLEQALLASPLAQNATWCVQPNWARGAKIFVDFESNVLQDMLPNDQALKPWHVVLCESDEEVLYEALAHLPEDLRRLKRVTGRRVMYCADIDSVQADVDPEHLVTDIEVRHTFVHFAQSRDDRSVQTA